MTRRRAVITLALSAGVLVRWWDANIEPKWPTYVPSYPAIQTGPNAASFYHAAVESYVDVRLPSKSQAEAQGWSDLSQKEAPLKFKRAAMQGNEEALKWLHEAGTKTYYGNFGGKWLKTQPEETVGPKLSNPVPDFIRTRELARMAAGSCDVLAAEGKHLAAVERALDIAKWGTDMTHDPTLIEAMIGILIQGIGNQKALEHIGSLSPEEAKIALARLESLPKPAPFADIVRHEEILVTNTYADIFKMGNVSGFQSEIGNLPSALTGRVAYNALLLWYTKRGLVKNYTDVMDEHARIGATPYRESLAAHTALKQRVESGQGMNFLTRIMIPNMLRARWAYEVKNTQREIIHAHLQLALWKAEHGQLPAHLSDLPQVPRDFFSRGAAEPLRYDSASGKVWSVGNNGIDDHGMGDDTLETQ